MLLMYFVVMTLDPIAISLIIAGLNYGNEFDFAYLKIPAFCIIVADIILGIGSAYAAMVMPPLLAQLLFLPLFAIVAGLIIGFVVGMSLQRAMIAGAIFAAYKLVFSIVFTLAMS